MKMKQNAVYDNISSLGNSKIITVVVMTVTLLFIITLTACTSMSNEPVQALKAAQFAIDNADRNRLSDHDLPDLAQARDKLIAARKAEQKNDMKLAKYLAEESLVSAELASAKTAYIKADQINKDIIKSIDVLKQEMQRNKGELK